MIAITAATRNHDRLMSTGVPAIDPTWSVPAGRRTGPRDPRSSLILRGYLTDVRRAASPRCRCPRLDSAHEQYAVPRGLAGRAPVHPGRRGRRPRRALPEPGLRLHDLPAALPLPHHRPAPRGAVGRRAARHARAQGARGPLRPARPRPHPRPGPRPARAHVGRPAGRRARPRRRSSPTRAPTSRSGSARAASCSTATSPSRTPAASSRPSASSTSRRCSTPGCSCAASSTGSTSRPTARSGWSTTRPAGRPARCSRPRRCSR